MQFFGYCGVLCYMRQGVLVTEELGVCRTSIWEKRTKRRYNSEPDSSMFVD